MVLPGGDRDGARDDGGARHAGGPPTDGSGVVTALQRRFEDLLRECVPTDRPWVLVGASRKYNPGDAALALGSLAAGRAIGARFVGSMPGRTFRADDIPREAVVLVHGGGNLGGLYAGPHALRLHVLETMRGHRVVQLPQSVEFTDAQHRDELRRAVGAHGDVLVMTRDARSEARAREAFDCPVVLSPDAAFGLGPLDRTAPEEAVRVLRRTDKERPAATDVAGARDWEPAGALSRRRVAKELLRALDRASGRPLVSGAADRLAWPVWNALSRANFRTGVRDVGRGATLLTDRLHGHLLAVLCGVPHVVVNDGLGKIEAMWQTWTHAVPNARYAASWDDAATHLGELVGPPG